jgi:beta-glucosidase
MTFPEDFVWGTATSALQIEGALNEEGRGESVWDDFARKQGPGPESYHHLEDDVALLKALGVKAYRFSVSWPRLIPEGIGKINPQGAAYYLRLVSLLRANGIEPYLTLFHWDYPVALEKQGGWLNPHAPEWFAEYAKAVAKLFDGLVFHYFTINEPQCFVELGYAQGLMAPWKKLPRAQVLQIAQAVLLGNGLAFRALKANSSQTVEVGMAQTTWPGLPENPANPQDIEAARAWSFSPHAPADLVSAAYWSDPIFLGHYNEVFLRAFGGVYEPKESDLAIIQEPFDVYGINLYGGFPIRATPLGPQAVPGEKVAKNFLGWEVRPSTLYFGPKFLYERYHRPIILSENGTCFADKLISGKVADPFREDYLKSHLLALGKAVEEGVPVKGYFYWSFLDNLEWANGFGPRFGLVYCDYSSGKRYPKDSFETYHSIIRANGLN